MFWWHWFIKRFVFFLLSKIQKQMHVPFCWKPGSCFASSCELVYFQLERKSWLPVLVKWSSGIPTFLKSVCFFKIYPTKTTLPSAWPMKFHDVITPLKTVVESWKKGPSQLENSKYTYHAPSLFAVHDWKNDAQLFKDKKVGPIFLQISQHGMQHAQRNPCSTNAFRCLKPMFSLR